MTHTTESMLAPARLFPALREALTRADAWTLAQLNAPLTRRLLEGDAR